MLPAWLCEFTAESMFKYTNIPIPHSNIIVATVIKYIIRFVFVSNNAHKPPGFNEFISAINGFSIFISKPIEKYLKNKHWKYNEIMIIVPQTL